MSKKNRAKFKFFESKVPGGTEWFWNLYAANNKIILSSEGYTTKWGAIRGSLSVRLNSMFDSRYESFRGTSKEWYFRLKAMNHKIIGKSEGYKRKAGAENGMASVKKNAKFASQQFKSL